MTAFILTHCWCCFVGSVRSYCGVDGDYVVVDDDVVVDIGFLCGLHTMWVRLGSNASHGYCPPSTHPQFSQDDDEGDEDGEDGID